MYDLLKIKNDVFTYVWKGKGEAKKGGRKEEGEGGREEGRKGGREEGRREGEGRERRREEGGRGKEILLLLNKIVSYL